MIVRTILRALWAPTVLILAVTLALGVLFVLGSMWVGDELRAAAPDDPMLRHGAASMFGMVLFAGAVTPALTILPAAIATGGAAMAAIPVLASPQTESLPTLPTGQYMTIFAAAGFVGGFVYWLLAGRGA